MNNITQIARTGIMAVLAGVLAGAGLFAVAAGTSLFEATNAFATDTVDISVEDSLDALDEPRLIIGDGEVPHTLTITNDGAPCFVRCKTIYTREAGSLILNNFADLAAGEWIAAEDGYVYRITALGEGETVLMGESVVYPEEWRSGEGFPMKATFVAEAVQARNFAPDFASGAPWGDLVAQECIHSRVGNAIGEVA